MLMILFVSVPPHFTYQPWSTSIVLPGSDKAKNNRCHKKGFKVFLNFKYLLSPDVMLGTSDFRQMHLSGQKAVPDIRASIAKALSKTSITHVILKSKYISANSCANLHYTFATNVVFTTLLSFL